MKKSLLLVVVLAAGIGAAFAYRVRTAATPRLSASRAVVASASTSVAEAATGPGLRPEPAGSLALPVPATFDLAHVSADVYAAALGNDVDRIFAFVRDEIAFEPYTGLLRGPRGTLLAMAGNSVDRAALLASLLAEAGHHVRFARGSLPDGAARDLVASTWARERPAAPAPDNDTSAPVREAAETFDAAVRRDFALVWEHARAGGAAGLAPPGDDFPSLMDETRDHYWVQWSHEGTWTDLDPSFADAAIGTTRATLQETFDRIPDSLTHRVTMRLRLEEYTGADAAVRDILTYSAAAADLSGRDAVLSHVPEHWQGPQSGLADAFASSLADTGRIKPVLTVGNAVVAGEVFTRQVKRTGLGGLGALLGGAGTRHAVPLATAEWLDIELSGPDRDETVVRELYDLVGAAQRRAHVGLSEDEVVSRTEGANAFDATQALYDVFFTTGAIDAGHLAGVRTDEPPTTSDVVDIGTLLQRLNLAFMTTSDNLLARLGSPERSLIRLYPDAPRFVIAEVAAPRGTPRLQLDLRRVHSRRVVLGARPEDGLAASLLEGVVNGALERTLVEYATAGARARGTADPMSTSVVFERAQAENARILLLPRDRAQLGDGTPAEALARLDEDASRGLLAVAPERPVLIAGVPRFGWWRVDPRTGETTAVTDEGLHQAATEYRMVEHNSRVTVVVRTRDLAGITQTETTFNTLAGALRFVDGLIARGATLVEGNFWLPSI